jgi:hypothetical protein
METLHTNYAGVEEDGHEESAEFLLRSLQGQLILTEIADKQMLTFWRMGD